MFLKSAVPGCVVIPPNRTNVVSGFVTDMVSCHRLAMVQSTEKTILPGGAEIHQLLSTSVDRVQVLLK